MAERRQLQKGGDGSKDDGKKDTTKKNDVRRGDVRKEDGGRKKTTRNNDTRKQVRSEILTSENDEVSTTIMSEKW
jgi:hypothetical protein